MNRVLPLLLLSACAHRATPILDATHPAPREAWDAFKRLSGLTEAELSTIASNVPPWL